MPQSTSRDELRLAAVAGWLSAAVLLVNTSESAGLVPAVPAVHLVAPFAQIFAIGLVLGLYVAFRPGGGGLLTAGLAGNLIALTALAGVAFVLNLVFPYLERPQIDDLLAGPLSTALLVASILFVLATLTYVAGLWRGGAPRVPLTIYAVAAMPIGLRAFVPAGALQIALVLLAAALTWLAITLWRTAAPEA